jgi:hypothetical protein
VLHREAVSRRNLVHSKKACTLITPPRPQVAIAPILAKDELPPAACMDPRTDVFIPSAGTWVGAPLMTGHVTWHLQSPA